MIQLIFVILILSCSLFGKEPSLQNQQKSWVTWYQKALGLVEGSQRATKTIVAVIDTGLDTTHPALKKSLWRNPGETGLDEKGRSKESNGLDDDHNGFVDDVHGWNFVGQNSDLADHHGHGTHIAGLIAADSSEFSGVAPGTQVMVLKYFDPQAPFGSNMMNSVRAIHYAIRMGAHIINYSGGGPEAHALEKQALELARKKNITVVAAAGNEASNSDLVGFYPASYQMPHVLAVTALGPDLKRVPSSNWGPQRINLSAPGEQIFSTLPDQKMGYMTGTSQATALVTGLLVLLREKKPELRTPEELIRHLIQSGEFNTSLVGELRTPKRVSLKRALLMSSTFSSEKDRYLSTYQP